MLLLFLGASGHSLRNFLPLGAPVS